MVSCKKCGACCRYFGYIPLYSEDYDDEFIEPFIVPDDEDTGPRMRMTGKGVDSRCAALDPRTNQCTIYEHRPLVCREMEPGGSGCRAAREYFEESAPELLAIS